MKNQLHQLQKTVNTARQELLSAQTLTNKLLAAAKTAKAKSRQLKAEHKNARAAARAAKRVALDSQEKLDQKREILAKATRRLEKAYKKQGKRPPTTANSRVAKRPVSAVKAKRPASQPKAPVLTPVPVTPPAPERISPQPTRSVSGL